MKPLVPNAILRGVTRIPLTSTITVLAIATASIPGLAAMLQFDRGLVQTGQLWRIATCHLTHWNVEHLQWDLLMFVVLGTACELRNDRQMQSCALVAAASVSALVFFAFPNIITYRGLSGIDTALFTLLAFSLLADARHSNNRTMLLATTALIAGFCIKTAYEVIAGHALFVHQNAAGFEILVWDHVLAGAIGACVAFSNKKPSSSLHCKSTIRIKPRPVVAETASHFGIHNLNA